MICIPIFWKSVKIGFLRYLFLKNRNFDIWESIIKSFENPRYPFCRACNLTSFGVCCLHFTLKAYILEAFECWPIFDPKSRDMTSLKRHFLKNFWTDFAEILFEDTKLMLNKVQLGLRNFETVSTRGCVHNA